MSEPEAFTMDEERMLMILATIMSHEYKDREDEEIAAHLADRAFRLTSLSQKECAEFGTQMGFLMDAIRANGGV